MPIEIEKKYRLSKKQREEVLRRLPEIGARRQGEEFEVNTLYKLGSSDLGNTVLRLRRIEDRGILTYKQRVPSDSGLKHQREEETAVEDPDAMETILEALGLVPAAVYEKWRETWLRGKAEIVIDVLPFGLFMEIEGTVNDINDVESKLAIKGLRAETLTYPRLTLKHGKDRGGIIESRFRAKKSKPSTA